MGTYDWMELQTLTNEIALARSRLSAARATKDMGKARGLEEEIARAERQREQLLAHITTNLVTAPDPAPKGGKDAKTAPAAAAEPPAPPPAAAKDAKSAPAVAVTPDPPAPLPVAAKDAKSAPAAAVTPDPPAPPPAAAKDAKPAPAAAVAAEPAAPPPAAAKDAKPAAAVAPEPAAPVPATAKDARPVPAPAVEEPPVATAKDANPVAASAPVVAAPPEAAAKDPKLPEPSSEPEAVVEDVLVLEAVVETQAPKTAEDRVAAAGTATPVPAPKPAGANGGINVWDQLKSSDIERAKQEIETRRTEMLARHAEELRGLEADRNELVGLEQAIAALVQKFILPSGAGDVVKLEEKRQQTAG